MKANPLDDKAIIAAIQAGGQQRQEALKRIYHNPALRASIIAFVKSKGGNEADGQDMYHEGIIVLDRNIRQGKFREATNLQGYLYSICRFIWMNRARKQSKISLNQESVVYDGPAEETPESSYFDTERNLLLQQVLEQLDDRCRKILRLWQLSYSMAEIASQVNLSSPAMARKTKYRCHQALLKYLKDHPQIAESLKNSFLDR